MEPLILHIDTAISRATLGITRGNQELAYRENEVPKEQASWIQPAIRSCLIESGIGVKDLNAISVSAGPGSYTGLRVGLATAKGLCYALRIPLILLNTLEVMADAAMKKYDAAMACPMIDARRMEVYAALYNTEKEEIIKAGAYILNADFLQLLPSDKKIIFIGNGCSKFSAQLTTAIPNFAFGNQDTDARDMYPLSIAKYSRADFADLAYAEPFYLKEFHQA